MPTLSGMVLAPASRFKKSDMCLFTSYTVIYLNANAHFSILVKQTDNNSKYSHLTGVLLTDRRGIAAVLGLVGS